MFPSDFNNSITSPLNGNTGLNGLGAGGNDRYGLMGAANFEFVIMQIMLRLLDRLENRLSAPATSGPAGQATTPPNALDLLNPPPYPPYLVYAPATGSFAAQQVYAPVAPQPAGSLPPITAPAPVASPSGALPISAFPKPPGDNGRGMHWIPTVSQSPEAVDRFVGELRRMNMKWVTFLNDGSNIGGNDYLVRQLKANGMEPVMRVYVPGLSEIGGDLGAMVRHYKSLGVNYFQLYNEPNHSVENDGQHPDVNRYLDRWIPAARTVIENGGLPGFGALSPGGEFKDTDFLAQSIDGLKARGQAGLLDRAWLSIHNYQGDRPVGDTEGFTRFKVYADLLQHKLGRLMPMIGTEGGTFTSGPADEPRRVQLVTDAYRYMNNREPYNFAYSYWVVANGQGGGHDPAWEWQALFGNDGTSPLVEALQQLPA
jgi:hypothetical protein